MSGALSLTVLQLLRKRLLVVINTGSLLTHFLFVYLQISHSVLWQMMQDRVVQSGLPCRLVLAAAASPGLQPSPTSPKRCAASCLAQARVWKPASWPVGELSSMLQSAPPDSLQGTLQRAARLKMLQVRKLVFS